MNKRRMLTEREKLLLRLDLILFIRLLRLMRSQTESDRSQFANSE